MPKYKIFLIFCLSFILGIALASFLKINFFVCYFILLVVIVLLVLGWQNKLIKVTALMLVFFIVGILRYNLSFPKSTPEKIHFYNGEKLVWLGRVIRIDERLDRRELVLNSIAIFQNSNLSKVGGKVLVFTPLYSEYKYGDVLEISCLLREPESKDGFAYHEYLARSDIYSICWPKEINILERNGGNFLIRQILKIKEKIRLAINQSFTEPQGAIFSALILGLKKEIPQSVRSWFSLTGTAHILAISGLHVAILTKILFDFAVGLLFLKRQQAFYFVTLFLIFFIVLTGAPASAIRAGIMGFLVLFAQQLGRKGQGINLIALAATLMLLVNPKLLKSDIGFQLSFTAVLGMALFNDYFYQLFGLLKFLPGKLKRLKIQDILATTFSAYLFSLPLVLYHFGNLSLVAPLANILILPILPFLMSFGFLFAFFSLIYLGLAKFLVWPAWLILTYIIWLVKILANLPYLSFNLGRINFAIVIFLYILIIFFVFRVRKINQVKQNVNQPKGYF
jgi:competence protein ComEC